MGCQFINVHNKPISKVFNFNTNIKIGDASQVFYSTLYTSKSTQDKDSKTQIRIGRAVIKQIKRVLNDNHKGEPSFGEGLSRCSIWTECGNNQKRHQCYNGTSHSMQWWIKICILAYFFRLASWEKGGNIGGSRRQCAHPIKQTTKQDYNLARFPCQ